MACQGYQWKKMNDHQYNTSHIYSSYTDQKAAWGNYRDFFSYCSWRHMGTADHTWALILTTLPKMPPNQSYDGERNSLDGSSLSMSSQDSNANLKEPKKSSLVKAAEEGSREWSCLSVWLHESVCSWLSELKRLCSSCWRARRGRTADYFSFPCAVTALGKAGSGLVFSVFVAFPAALWPQQWNKSRSS